MQLHTFFFDFETNFLQILTENLKYSSEPYRDSASIYLSEKEYRNLRQLYL